VKPDCGGVREVSFCRNFGNEIVRCEFHKDSRWVDVVSVCGKCERRRGWSGSTS